MLNTVIVGAGLMGQQHARASAQAGAEVVAVVDRDMHSASALARRHRKARAFGSLGDALAETDAQVVHICTPSHTHAKLASLAARAEAHALIEKPVGESAYEVERIAAAFDASGNFFCPVHQYAFQRAIETALGNADGMGRLLRVEFDIRSAGGPDGKNGRDRCVADIFPHPLSIIQRIRPGTDVSRLDWHLHRPSAGEWLCTAPLGDGASTSISLSLAARPTCFKSQLLFEAGEIDIDHFNAFASTLKGPPTRIYKIIQPFHRNGRGLLNAATNLGRRIAMREWAYPGLLELVRLFYLAVSTGNRSALPVLPEEALAVATTRDRFLAEALRIEERQDR